MNAAPLDNVEPDWNFELEWPAHNRTYHIRYRSLTVAEMISVQDLRAERIVGDRALVDQQTKILEMIVDEVTVDDARMPVTELPIDAFREVYSALPLFRIYAPEADRET
ncbi:MAG: hypothetical protein OXM88_09305 [bacterium]|nr:hypothetical protein [bacterium]